MNLTLTLIPNAGIPNAGIPNAEIPNAGIPNAGFLNIGIPGAGTFSQNTGRSQESDVPVWARDNGGLIANSDMLAIGATLIVVMAVKVAALFWRR